MPNNDISLDNFLLQYPEFNNDEYMTFLAIAFRQAKNYIELRYRCLDEEIKRAVIYLLTAHLATIKYRVSKGDNGSGFVSSATVGEVSVSYGTIPNQDNLSYWLSLTPYGLELLALLDDITPVCRYVGGSLERVF